MNILKRVLIHVCGYNLGLLMRKLLGVGTPRGLQGLIATLWRHLDDYLIAFRLLPNLWDAITETPRPLPHPCCCQVVGA